ncbi:probable G-protein coupled receptor 132 [Tiliqua scincoides]|uniref:probable G-protein coupled receptor 132 n=1 Tax=Tiliqua scincoides TaxID=71010 RepID=UPI0034620781
MATANNSTDPCKDPMPFEESKQLLVIVYSLVFAVGLPANCITAALTLVQIIKGNVPAIYLFGLSLCELLYLSTIPLWIIYVQNSHQWMMGLLSCKVTGYIFFCNIYISILLLCCISIDRYVAVAYALESRGIRSQRVATVVTVALFAVVAGIYLPVFFTDIQANVKTCFETSINHRLAVYNVSRFFVGFVIPFVLLIVMNYKIFQGIQGSCTLTLQQKAKVKYLLIAIICIFVICFAPYHFVLIVRSVHYFLYPEDACRFDSRVYTISVVFLCFSTANSVADPFLYVLASENARQEISRTFKACRIQLSFRSQTDNSKASNIQRTLKDNFTLDDKEDR